MASQYFVFPVWKGATIDKFEMVSQNLSAKLEVLFQNCSQITKAVLQKKSVQMVYGVPIFPPKITTMF